MPWHDVSNLAAVGGQMSAGFIAETDGSGRVIWVWRKGANDKIARPVSDPAAAARELRTAQCSGAPVEAISDWFARQATKPS